MDVTDAQPVLDVNGHLRLAWWPANEFLKENPISLTKTSVILNTSKTNNGYQIVWLDNNFGFQKGAIFEGTITAYKLNREASECAAGFAFNEGNEKLMAIQLGIGSKDKRETHIGKLRMLTGGAFEFVSEDVTVKILRYRNGY